MINQDPRSTQGIMARGANVYQGGSMSPYAGKVTASSLTSAPKIGYQKLSLQDVARKALGK